MKILGSLPITLAKGEHSSNHALRRSDLAEHLHHYLSIDSFDFKKNTAERMPEIENLSTCIMSNAGELE